MNNHIFVSLLVGLTATFSSVCFADVQKTCNSEFRKYSESIQKAFTFSDTSFAFARTYALRGFNSPTRDIVTEAFTPSKVKAPTPANRKYLRCLSLRLASQYAQIASALAPQDPNHELLKQLENLSTGIASSLAGRGPRYSNRRPNEFPAPPFDVLAAAVRETPQAKEIQEYENVILREIAKYYLDLIDQSEKKRQSPESALEEPLESESPNN